MIATNSLWHLVAQSDSISKIVLFILLIMSIGCWTFFIARLLFLIKKKYELAKSLAMVDHAFDLTNLTTHGLEKNGTTASYLIARNCAFLKLLLGKLDNNASTLNNEQLTMFFNNLDQTVDDIVEKERASIPLLAMAAGVAPLLGLFGTVWGLVHAFVSISEQQMADIATIAPGIAEALVTTLVGLLVAIPALIMFNLLSMQVRSFEIMVQKLADRIAVIVELSLFVRSYHASTTASTPTINHDRSFTNTAC
jgi:biopolymer transport protein ExbB/TolQ